MSDKPKRIFQIVSLLFFCESILLLLGLHYGFLSYGPDLSSYFMIVLIVVIGFVVFILNMIFLEREMSSFLSIIFTVAMFSIGLYYLLENQFEIF